MTVVRDVAVVAGKWLSLLMGVLVLVAGLLLAAFVFIRSSAGESWLSESVRQVLADRVPGVTFTALRGPLPERLEVQGLRLADEQGEWLRVDRLTLVPDLVALLEKRVVVTELVINGPRLSRLPDFATDPAAPVPASPPLTLADITDWLNLLPADWPALTVTRLALRDGELGAPVAGGLASLEALDATALVRLTPGDALDVNLHEAKARLTANGDSPEQRGLPGAATVALHGTARLRVGGLVSGEGRFAVEAGEGESLLADWAVTPAPVPTPAPATVPAPGLVAKLATTLEATPRVLNGLLAAGLLPQGLLPSGVEAASAPLHLRLDLQTALEASTWLEASGTLEAAGGLLDANAQLACDWQASPAQVVVRSLHLEALGLALTGQGTLPLDRAAMDQGQGGCTLTVQDWKILTRLARLFGLPKDYEPLLTAQSLRAEATLHGADLRASLAVDGWDARMDPLRLQASLRLPDGALTAQTNLAFPLAVLRRVPQLATLTDLPDGQLRAEARVAGTLLRPEASLNLTLDEVRLPGLPLPDSRLELTARLAPASGFSAQGSLSGVSRVPANFTAHLAVPYGASGPVFSTGAALAGRLDWNGPLADWWRLLPVAGQRVKGTGLVRLDVAGTLAEPVLEGEVTLRDGSWDDRTLGLAVSPVNAALLWQGGDAKLQLEAGDGRGGRFTAAGRVDGPAKGFGLAAQGTLHRFAPLRRNDVRVVISGTTTLRGTLFAPEVGADLTVDEGGVRLANLPESGIAELAVTEKQATASSSAPSSAASFAESSSAPSSAGGALAVKVQVPGRFFVRGRGIDSEWRGQVDVNGPLASPRVTGELSSVRGTLDLLGKTFTLAVGRIILDGQQPPNPALDIVLRYAMPTLVAEAALSGSVDRPRLTLSSQPALPQDEVVAHVLFGTSVAALNSAQALQLAASVAALAGFGDGGAGLLNTARRVLGVDVLRVGAGNGRGAQRYGSNRLGLVRDSRGGGEAENAGSLEAGKYLSDKVYLGVEQGLGPDSGAVRMEVELTPNISLEARTSSKAADIGVNWKKDY